MNIKDYTRANQAAWDEAAPYHEKACFKELENSFKQAGFSTLDDTAQGILSTIGLKNKNVAQLGCNNGRELLSVKNLGASRCTGFDISKNFISQAVHLAEVSNLECNFISGDLYDIPSSYDNVFDLVFSTIGVLGWMPDLQKFFAVSRRLLRQGGWLFIYEMHPILDMYEPDCQNNPPELVYSYFKDTPWKDTSGLDYYSKNEYQASPAYYFHHTLSQVVSGCINAGYIIKSFSEYPHDISNEYAFLEGLSTRLPMCFTLTAQAT